MDKFATGVITGGIVTAIGVAYAMNDRKTRRKMYKGSRRAMSKAASTMNDLW